MARLTVADQHEPHDLQCNVCGETLNNQCLDPNCTQDDNHASRDLLCRECTFNIDQQAEQDISLVEHDGLCPHGNTQCDDCDKELGTFMKKLLVICDFCKNKIAKGEGVRLLDYYTASSGSQVSSVKIEKAARVQRSAINLHESCFFLVQQAILEKEREATFPES